MFVVAHKMGCSESKVRCLFLPAQSGKTRKVEEQIRELKRLSRINDSHSIDIFISANSRLLVHQTSARLRSDLTAATATATDEGEDPRSIDASSEITDDDLESDAAIKGKIFSWTHGRATGISAEALSEKILLGVLSNFMTGVEMVLMCANKRRFRYLADMLTCLTSNPAFQMRPTNIYIWIDEADSSMNYWCQFEDLLAMPAITRVTLISATLGRVLAKYERLAIIPYENTHPVCYRRLADCACSVITDAPKDACKFVAHVLTKHAAELCVPGRRAFIPGAYTKMSHYDIAHLLATYHGFAVIIINGDCKELRIPGEATVDLREYLSCADPEQLPAEFNQTLAELYIKHNLARFPFAITGYLCIQRGVTFQCAPEAGKHEGFVFNYGIVPPISDKAEAYQTMARMFGNTGDFPNYVRPTIYANEKTFAGVRDQEETAVNLPRIVFEEGLADVGPEEFARATGVRREIAKEHEFVHDVREFASWEEAKSAFPRIRKPKQNADGFYLTTTTSRPTKQSYASVWRLCNGKKTAAMPWKGLKVGASVSRLSVGYRVIDDPTSAVWVVRTLTRVCPMASHTAIGDNTITHVP